VFSVLVLTYGHYEQLTRRCLNSILKTATKEVVADVRVGMNAVGDDSRETVKTFARAMANCGIPVTTYESARNVYKYPMMRKMLYDPDGSPPAELVMWFDDDSYLIDPRGTDWWGKTHSAVWNQAAVAGSIYYPTYSWTKPEQVAFTAQPWYGGQPCSNKPKFATGAWWVADLGFLKACDYPSLELKHNGGDVLLGEMCRQQGAVLKNYREGVAINADSAGRESKARRRGVTTPRPFEGWQPAAQPDYTHHGFDVTVTEYRSDRSEVQRHLGGRRPEPADAGAAGVHAPAGQGDQPG